MIQLNFNHWQDLLNGWHVLIVALILALAWTIGVDLRINLRKRVPAYILLFIGTSLLNYFIPPPQWGPPLYGEFDKGTYNIIFYAIIVIVVVYAYLYKPSKR